MNWKDLSLREKAAYIHTGVRNGLTNLRDIEEAYNSFADGGDTRNYETWAKLMRAHYGFDVTDPNSDYDMRAYYKRHTDEAWDRLNKPPYHFSDGDEYGTFKTLNHPTYPDKGDNSWNTTENVFYPSDRQMGNSDRILDYLGSDFGYNSGATGVSYDNGIVLPTVYVTPNGGYTDLRRNRLNTGWIYNDRPAEYSDGGDIHIKKSHEGRLTELKERTGKTEAELYASGSPAVRKMVTFARNARKWNHGNGGYLL